MGRKKHCTYCGCKTNGTLICNHCYEKKQLIQKIRAIVFEIKRQAQREMLHD